MPKMKTHKGTAKRFRVTRTGKVLRMKGHHNHNKQKKNKRSIHAGRRMHELGSSTQAKKVKQLLPYG